MRRNGRIVLATAGVALVLVGGASLGLSALQHDEGGFFTTASATLTTPTSALVSDEVMVQERRPGNATTDVGDLAQVRVRAREPGAKAVFIGIGRKPDVEAYLREVSHDQMSRFDLNPFAVHYTRTPGGPALPPADQPFWIATATGPGTQTLLWNKERGAWSVVAMNADGTLGVTVRSDIGLRFGFLLPAGVTLLATGTLMLTGFVRRNLQRSQHRGAATADSTSAME